MHPVLPRPHAAVLAHLLVEGYPEVQRRGLGHRLQINPARTSCRNHYESGGMARKSLHLSPLPYSCPAVTPPSLTVKGYHGLR